MDKKYILEIENRKLELLQEYLFLLEKIEKLPLDLENFEEKVNQIFEKLANSFDQLIEYNKVFLSLTKDNNDLISSLLAKTQEEERIKSKILSEIDIINNKFSNESIKIKESISKLKFQNNNPLSENSSRFFEKEI